VIEASVIRINNRMDLEELQESLFESVVNEVLSLDSEKANE
jgi:hypothetical protein